MARVLTLETTAPPRPGAWPAEDIRDTGPGPAATTLPHDWAVLEQVPVGGGVIDRVIVGPNGVFAVHFDPDLRPAAVREHGVIRNGVRVKEPVKTALRNAFALRALLAPDHPLVHPYPVLVTETPGNGARLGRLLVVRPGRLAEGVWQHLSRPMTRSERARIVALLRSA